MLWAQTKDRILLKINTSATDVEVQLNELSVNVKGTDTNSKAPFSVDIELFKSIDTTVRFIRDKMLNFLSEEQMGSKTFTNRASTHKTKHK